MTLKEISKLKDNRTNCYSTLFEMTLEDYINLVEDIYKEKGGLKEQREPLKTSSAIRIRRQMVKDIIAGGVLPPIVLGVIVSEEQFDNIREISNENFSKILSDAKNGNLTIIDGMQRTTALKEAIDEKGTMFEQTVRVEFWISTKLNSLIYRMLILNTGQVPWNLRRQVETVFTSMVNEMEEFIPEMELIKVNDGSRRTRGGQYHANDIIELYLAFGGRKEKVDTKERLADEFTRLEFIEATEKDNFSDIFYKSLKWMTLLDVEISRYQNEDASLKFSTGKDLFKSQPAKVGFITAIAKKIYGRPGVEKNIKNIEQQTDCVKQVVEGLIEKLKEMQNENLNNFLSLDTLSERISVKSSKVGDFEREFFTKSFETLLDTKIEEITSMKVCWLSY